VEKDTTKDSCNVLNIRDLRIKKIQDAIGAEEQQ
jgi:hypothetical protein